MQKTVLLIESDPSFAQAMSAALELRGFGVRTSPDGKEGVELARALHPDCVVLCVELPGLSGYSWCNRLKKDEALKRIPLVITSSEATPETFEQHRKLKTRAEDYLLKPFPPETLVERVGALVGLPEVPPDEELVTLDDVELEAGASGAATAEEDDDLRMLDDAFDNITRGSDEPGAGTAGGPGSEPPLTLLPDADESPALLDLDREMNEAIAALAEEASKAAPVPHPAPPAPAPAPAPAPSRAMTPAVPIRVVEPEIVPGAEEETPILLEDVEVLPGSEEQAEALRLAQEEAETARGEAARARNEAETARNDAAAAREEAEAARAEAAAAREEAEAARQEGAAARAEIAAAREEAAAALQESRRLEDERAALDREVATLREESASVRDEATALRNDAAAQRDAAEAAALQLSTREGELAALVAELQSARTASAHLDERASGQEREMASLRTRLAEAEQSASVRASELIDATRRTEELEVEVETLRAEVGRLRADGESARAEGEGLRGELAALQAAVAALRAESESHAAAAVESRRAADEALAASEGRAATLTGRLQELEGQVAQHEDRVLRAYQKIKSDEKLREKTRKALAMVLQILEERPGGDGSAPPGTP